MCLCDQGYFPAVTGFCQPKMGINEQCTHNAGCLESQGLICLDGSCQCNSSESIGYASSGKWVVKAGSFCINSYQQAREGGMPCVDGAAFSQTETYGVDEDGPFSIHLCKFYQNFFNNVEGKCEIRLGYNLNCTSDAECQNERFLKLRCDAGLCKCEDSKDVYDKDRNICGKLSGRYFSETSNESDCVAGSFCMGIRECNDCYVPHEDGVCYIKPIKETGVPSCSARGPYHQCSKERGFICDQNESKCKYEGHQYFDDDLGSCLSLVGGPFGGNQSIPLRTKRGMHQYRRRVEHL